MTYEEWKGEKKAEAAQRQTVGEVIAGKARIELRRVKGAVEEYAEAQRVFGLTAPGFSPRPRKTVQLPKAEYARVQSEIATNYTRRFGNKSSGSMAVGDYIYRFEVEEPGVYRIVGKRKIKGL